MSKTPVENSTERSLEEVLGEVSLKNRQAFSILYRQTSSRLYAVLIRVLQNSEEAADVLQEVYITIWQRAGMYDPIKGGALTWMATITRNAGIDALRRRRKGEVSDECCAEIAHEGPSAFDTFNENESRNLLRAKLDALPPKQRQAVMLFYIEERSIAETAEIMRTPLNTAKSWIRRGVKRLHGSLADRQLADLV